MDDLCRVQVLDTSQDLVEKYFNVVLGQVLRRYYDLVQIRLHEFSDHVDLLKEVYVGRLKETKNTNCKQTILKYKYTIMFISNTYGNSSMFMKDLEGKHLYSRLLR